MIDLIKSKNDRKFKDVATLQNSDLPVIVYGAGSYAVDVSKFLTNQGIKVSEYCVDHQWLSPDLKIEGKSVRALEQVIEEYEDFLVVIGFADYKKAAKRLTELAPGKKSIFIDAPNQFGFFDFNFIRANQDEFEKTYEMLEDELSRDIFIAFLNAKLSGDPSSLYEYANFDQYFSDPVLLSDHEVMVDCGAYDGDTIRALLAHTNGRFEKIFAFEPNYENFIKLSRMVDDEDLNNVELINKGAWSRSGVIKFKANENMTVLGSDGSESVEVDSIDNIVGSTNVTFIKMDIEGAEIEALKGAKNVIRTRQPKLAICVYHKPDDLIVIPRYIKSLYPNYKFYIRHHQYMSWEMVLYAIPEQ